MKTTVFMVRHKPSGRWLPRSANVGLQNPSGWVTNLWDARQYMNEETAGRAIFAASITPYGQFPYPRHDGRDQAWWDKAVQQREAKRKARRQEYANQCEVVKVDVTFTLTSMPSRPQSFGQVGGRKLEA